MMEMQNFTMTNDPEPEWMRAERYDYCDHFSINDASRLSGIRAFLNKIFKK